MVEGISADVVSAVRGIFSSFVNNLIIAAIILLIGFIAGRLLGNLIQRLLHEVELDKFVKLSTGIKFSAEGFAGGLVSYTIYFISVVMALDKLGLNTFLFNVIAGGVILVIILSMLLALKDIVPNMVAGFFIQNRNLIRPGDRIIIDGVEGKVKAVQITDTRLETKKKDTIYIPNALILRKELYKKKS